MNKHKSEPCHLPIRGPLGSLVGYCELHRDHEGPCKFNRLTEQDMIDRLASNGLNDD